MSTSARRSARPTAQSLAHARPWLPLRGAALQAGGLSRRHPATADGSPQRPPPLRATGRAPRGELLDEEPTCLSRRDLSPQASRLVPPGSTPRPPPSPPPRLWAWPEL